MKAMAGALYPPPGLVAELDSSLSLLEAGGGRVPPAAAAEQQQQRRRLGAGAEDADLLPMVFLCAGCKRPVGDTLSWVTNDEEAGCILLRSESRTAPPCPARRPLLTSLPPSPLCAGAAGSVAVDEERKLSKRPGECGW